MSPLILWFAILVQRGHDCACILANKPCVKEFIKRHIVDDDPNEDNDDD